MFRSRFRDYVLFEVFTIDRSSDSSGGKVPETLKGPYFVTITTNDKFQYLNSSDKHFPENATVRALSLFYS